VDQLAKRVDIFYTRAFLVAAAIDKIDLKD
jgi:hypothetical protein